MSGRGELILNVDDTEAIRYAKTRALRHAGLPVLEAATGAEALRLAAAERPALVLLDVKLPDIAGTEVCRRIKQDFPGMLVLQISASFVAPTDRVRGLESGADSYLTQPVEPGELVAAVRALLRLRRAEQTAQETEARYRLIVESATDYAIITTDGGGRMTSWNPGAERILGYGAAEAVGEPIDMIFTPEDRASGVPEMEMRRARETGRGGDDRWHLRKGGERFWVNGVMMPLRGADGALQGYLKILRDQSERQRAAAALAESEARFRAIADAMPQIVWSTTPEGVHDYCNRRWYEFTGLSETAGGREDWERVMHPGDVARTRQAWEHSLATGADYEVEYRFRRAADGAYRWFIARALPVRDAEGRITRWFGTCTDIQELVEAREVNARGRAELERLVAERTEALKGALDRLSAETAERERTEEALRQSQKMEAVGQLTGGIAHDFNNLLTGIAGSLELIQTRIAQGRVADVGRHVTAAMGSVTRAASLTHRLLAFARRQALDPKPVDINRLVVSMEELIRRTVGSHVTVETVLAGGLWPTLCDANQLENALLNLCINARDAMPEGGRLTIETANAHLDEAYTAKERDLRPGQYVALSVSDSGSGMTPEVIARAFDPFFTTKPIGQGTGLGLSMLYGFVKQSGGHVRIYSEPGQGTTMRLYLPRHHIAAAEPDIAESRPASPSRAPAGQAVLVVEDEPVVRMLMMEVLEGLGCAALEAADGPAALRILQSDARVDLLLTDVGLPGMNGRQLAEAARERRPGLKVLFVTGYARNAAVGTGMLAPGMQMIAKPFALDVLAARIRAMLGI